MRKLLQLNCGIRLTREKSKIMEKTLSNCKYFRYNLTWNGLRSKAGLRGN